jgi:hypothetical protein
VPVGVEFELSTLDFLDPDLGVILLLKKEATGVVRSSLWGALGVMSWRVARLNSGVEILEGVEPATLGVNGVVFTVFMPETLMLGTRGLWP